MDAGAFDSEVTMRCPICGDEMTEILNVETRSRGTQVVSRALCATVDHPTLEVCIRSDRHYTETTVDIGLLSFCLSEYTERFFELLFDAYRFEYNQRIFFPKTHMENRYDGGIKWPL